MHTLPHGSALQATITITTPDGAPATGLADVHVWLADSEGGAAIDPALVVVCGAEASANSGCYPATWTRAQLMPFTGARIGRDVFVVADDGASFRASARYRVTASQ